MDLHRGDVGAEPCSRRNCKSYYRDKRVCASEPERASCTGEHKKHGLKCRGTWREGAIEKDARQVERAWRVVRSPIKTFKVVT